MPDLMNWSYPATAPRGKLEPMTYKSFPQMLNIGRGVRMPRPRQRLVPGAPVDVPTHVSAITRFAGGGVSQSLLSFDSPLATLGVVEITGSHGTIVVPDPNMFTGEVKITRAPIRPGPLPLASGALGYHVLDTVMAMDESVVSGRTVDITSTVDTVPLVAEDWDPFAATV
jgi:hypothetical protein